jgi:hypothetical protein
VDRRPEIALFLAASGILFSAPNILVDDAGFSQGRDAVEKFYRAL